ncbi:hypothetical protein LSCM1_00946 [Leishmania martiniquensis]|uniref:Uncharacterized protein n=1 Tax=Leishmania martiniquensis TaxID=1580590 RepID=A0A836G5K6_9TRYP|nr:hypothetical protein LSCM1_00946 [Leishmania martiniquensis]
MLDPQAADLVDAVARLCVLRTEDYTLLQTVYARARGHHRQQQDRMPHVPHSSPEPAGDARGARESEGTASGAGNKAYIRYLTEEVRAREQRRSSEECEWLEAVQQWATCFQGRGEAGAQGQAFHAALRESASSGVPAIWLFWEHGGESVFQRVYAAVVQKAYELNRLDLTNTPFAHISGSKCLYDHRATAAVASVPVPPSHIKYVHALLFPPSQAAESSDSPSRILAEMHPIEAHDPCAVSEGRRSRLQASRHVWLVLFLLWCHMVAASMATSTSAAAAAERPRYESALLSPARDFLVSQSRQLQSLLEKLRKMACV